MSKFTTIRNATFFGTTLGASAGVISAAGTVVGKGMYYLARNMSGDAVDSTSLKYEMVVMTAGAFLFFTTVGFSTGLFIGTARALNEQLSDESQEAAAQVLQ